MVRMVKKKFDTSKNVGYGPRMSHYVTIDLNGWYHVQNVVSGYSGQHHVHSKEGFERWVRETHTGKSDLIIDNTPRACDCGLKPGDVRDHEGHVRHTDDWGD